MRYEFDWDPGKASANINKHEVAFEEAIGVFEDPLALSVPDYSGSADEERWITIGASGTIRVRVTSERDGVRRPLMRSKRACPRSSA